jgi:iron(III) transport system permease protein
MRYDTITRAIFSSRLSDRQTSLTLGLVLAVMALGVAVVERALAARSREVRALGSRQPTYGLGRARGPAVAVVWLVLLTALATPVGVFLVWILRGSATIGAGYTGIGDGMGFLVVPTINSALAAATAGFVAAVVVLPVAFSVVRRRTLVAEGASAAVTSVFALPGLVVALAVGFWAIQVPDPLAGLYQSFPLLIFAYVLHFGAQSMRSSQAAIAAVPERFDDAARTLGVSSRRRILEIDVPLIAPGLITGGGLVLLSTLKELPATLLLAPTGFETLATRIWGAAEDGFYAEVGISSLVLILLSALLTWFLILRPELTR